MLYHLELRNRLMGALDGGPQCRLSILRNGNVPCHYLKQILSIFKSLMSPVDFKKRPFSSVKFKGRGPFDGQLLWRNHSYQHASSFSPPILHHREHHVHTRKPLHFLLLILFRMSNRTILHVVPYLPLPNIFLLSLSSCSLLFW